MAGKAVCPSASNVGAIFTLTRARWNLMKALVTNPVCFCLIAIYALYCVPRVTQPTMLNLVVVINPSVGKERWLMVWCHSLEESLARSTRRPNNGLQPTRVPLRSTRAAETWR